MHQHEKLNYVEFPSRSLTATKTFFETVFDWNFTDYGPEYTAFVGEGLDGGFYAANLTSRSEQGAALLVFYSNDLEATLRKVEAAGGEIIMPTFAFPGGRRFHFVEPGGNELAVWSDLGV